MAATSSHHHHGLTLDSFKVIYGTPIRRLWLARLGQLAAAICGLLSIALFVRIILTMGIANMKPAATPWFFVILLVLVCIGLFPFCARQAQNARHELKRSRSPGRG